MSPPAEPGAPLRVASILRALPGGSGRGGVSYQVHHLSQRLAGLGHRITVFSTDPAPPDAGYDVRLLPVDPRRRERRSFLYWSFPRLVAAQSFAGFDVIHAHGDDQLLSRRARAGVPLLRTFWGSDLGEALADLRPGPLLGHALGYGFELLAGARADRTVAISEATRRALPFASEVIPPGVDLELFRPQAAEARSPLPSVLFVAGTLGGRKRGRLLLEAFRDVVRPAVPGAELWVVCPERVAGEAVRWLGALPADPAGMRALARLYASAWVFCLPSSYEGFGLPYAEALASGALVVATPNPGAREVLRDGELGLVVPPPELGQALVRGLTDAELRASLGARGRAHAARYSLDGVAGRYDALLRELAARGDRAAPP